MISRRNIRVKVMQELYAIQLRSDIQEKMNPVQNLRKDLEQTSQLFIYLLYFLTETARYAETDARLRASKNLPSEADRNVNIKLAGNLVLWKILENNSFAHEKNVRKISFEDTAEMVRKMYLELVQQDMYKQYCATPERDKKVEKDILSFIFTDIMLPDENFVQHVEEHFNNWDDDADMMMQLMMHYLQKPGAYNLQEMVGDEKRKFANDLLTTSIDRRELAMELIKPKLKNWDSERIASLDMILMVMGICEFLYFETIPPKVTINEYIDIAKEYSTQQSGQFINGILDNIHKELVAENKIHKIDFKQKT